MTTDREDDQTATTDRAGGSARTVDSSASLADRSPETAAARVLGLLAARGESLATAESLTGGLVGELLTAVPGASAAYVGGVITYATRLKATLAGVDPGTLDRLGPVAALTATQMAAGAAALCSADWGLSTTGVAGPDEQDGHPVGQVFVAVASPAAGVLEVRELALPGGREQVRRAAVTAVLALLEQTLGMRPGAPGVG